MTFVDWLLGLFGLLLCVSVVAQARQAVDVLVERRPALPDPPPVAQLVAQLDSPPGVPGEEQRFVRDGRRCLFVYHPAGGQERFASSEVVMEWGDRRPGAPSLELHTRDTDAPPSRLFSRRSLPTPWPRLDYRFTVNASDPAAPAALLSERAVEHLLVLREHGGSGPCYVRIDPRAMSVHKSWSEGPLSGLVSFKERALELFEEVLRTAGAREPDDAAVVLVRLDAPEDAGPCICQICGEPLGELVVACARCGTPHHEDCWRFTGCCSVYGCGSTECSAPVSTESGGRPSG